MLVVEIDDLCNCHKKNSLLIRSTAQEGSTTRLCRSR